ncbi:MAG: AAA family ATPase [Acidobacteriota bacterium]
MPKLDFNLTVIVQNLENDSYLAEALFFPELSSYDTSLKRLYEVITTNCRELIEQSTLLDLHRRRGYGTPEIAEVMIQLEPPPRSLAWKRALSLRFPLIRWQHGEEGQIAYLPTLGIEVVLPNAAQFTESLSAEIHSHLLRTKVAISLAQLAWLQRCQDLRVVELAFTAIVRSAKQIAANMGKDKEEKKSVLNDVGSDLTKAQLPICYEMDQVVAILADALIGQRPKSVLLVGVAGVGKTAVVYELVRRRATFQLSHTPFWATSGSRLVAGMSGFGMWQERCQRLWREASKEKAILYLGNLVELMEVGKSVSNSQGIAGFFRPYLARGDLLAIAECTPEQLPLIEREDPHLLDVFHQIKVVEPDVEKGRAILLNYVIEAGNGATPPIDFEGIETLDQLHRRYATYSAYPGRPIRFLKNLLQDRPSDQTLSASEVTRAFSKETGLPLLLLDESKKLHLAQTKYWFTERVIGQPEAVNLIVDLLAMVKARLTRPRKPIASLLFIGPTGVGKTEMAKSLAEFFFQDRNRMIRFDMSEYADPLAVKRLIGGVFGAEGLLTAKVREQPFAVILFDEFEKADPYFYDLLLQVLGEGRLTDAAGRVADFCNSIVIMTSNLGAESFQHSLIGFSSTGISSQEVARHFTSAVQDFVRPELFNRIDRIVPFAPLDRTTVLQIARRELERLKTRDGVQYRGVTMNFTEEVADFLAYKGYDARYGARPLKRALERQLLVPLAEELNRYSADLALTAEVQVDKQQLRVNVRPRVDAAGRQLSALVTDSELVQLASQCAAARRDVQRLVLSPATLELHNNIYGLEQLDKRLSTRVWKRPEDIERLSVLPKLRHVADMIKALNEKAATLEDQMLLALYDKAVCDKPDLTKEVKVLTDEWLELLFTLYSLKFKNPDTVILAIYGENAKTVHELTRSYYDTAINSAAEVAIYEFVPYQGPPLPPAEEADTTEKGDKRTTPEVYPLLGRLVIKQLVEKPKPFFAKPGQGVIGIMLSITGRLAFPRYQAERGLHLFVEDRQNQRCLVHTSDALPSDYKPPDGIEKRGAIANQERRRNYNNDKSVIEDLVLKKKYPYYRQNIGQVLALVLEERLVAEARALIES